MAEKRLPAREGIRNLIIQEVKRYLQAGHTQHELAKAAGLSITTIYNIANEKVKNISYHTQYRLHRAMPDCIPAPGEDVPRPKLGARRFLNSLNIKPVVPTVEVDISKVETFFNQVFVLCAHTHEEMQKLIKDKPKDCSLMQYDTIPNGPGVKLVLKPTPEFIEYLNTSHQDYTIN